MSPAASVQELVGLEAIERGCAFLADGRAVAGLACASTPLALRGSDAALAVVEALRGALAAPPAALQLLVETRALDVDAYLAEHAAASATEPHPRVRERAAGQRRFVAGLAADPTLLERRAYLLAVLAPPPRRAGGWRRPRPAAAAPASTPDRSEQVRLLDAMCNDLAASLRPAGVAGRRLTDEELAALIFRALLPGLAARQPLPPHLADLAAGPVAYAGPPLTR
jgi:hypothetical protein